MCFLLKVVLRVGLFDPLLTCLPACLLASCLLVCSVGLLASCLVPDLHTAECLVPPPSQRCQEVASQGKTSNGQGCQTDRPSLKPTSINSSLGSVCANHWEIAVGQGVKVPVKPIVPH